MMNDFQVLIQAVWAAVDGSGHGPLIGAVLAVMAGAALFGKPAKSKLATGRWGGRPEKATARRLAYQQMQARLFNQVALYIGTPRYAGDARSIYLPDQQRGVCAIGAPGTGKSQSFIDPLIRSALQQSYPVICFDAKYPVQASRHAAYAKHLGYDIQVFAPGYPESEVCNLLDFLRDERDGQMAFEIAKVLAKNFGRDNRRSGDSYFDDTGQQLIQAMLQFTKGTPFPDLLMTATLLGLSNLGQRVEAKKEIDPALRMAFMSLRAVKDSEKTVASIVGTAASYFQQFVDPRIITSFIGTTSLNLDLNDKQLLVLGLDRERRSATAPLLATVLHLLVTRNVTRLRDEPLVVVLDELVTLYLPELVNWLNWYREQGLVMILGIQNISQLQHLYQEHRAKAIFGACATKVLLNPQEFHSAKLFSDLLGDEVIHERQRSRTQGHKQRTVSTAIHHRVRKLFEPSQFLRLGPGQCVLLSPGSRSRKEVGLPLRLNVSRRALKRDLKLEQRSVAQWERLQQWLLTKTAQQPLPADAIAQRLALAEAILPAAKTAPTEGMTPEALADELDDLANGLMT